MYNQVCFLRVAAHYAWLLRNFPVHTVKNHLLESFFFFFASHFVFSHRSFELSRWLVDKRYNKIKTTVKVAKKCRCMKWSQKIRQVTNLSLRRTASVRTRTHTHTSTWINLSFFIISLSLPSGRALLCWRGCTVFAAIECVRRSKSWSLQPIT